MVYSVTIERQFSENAEANANQPCDGQTVRVTMTVTAFTDLDDGGVFVYVVDPVTLVERYDHVALPCDLQRYNLDVAGGLDFVRKTSIDLYRANAEEAEDLINTVDSSVQDLVDELASLDALAAPVTTTYTGTP